MFKQARQNRTFEDIIFQVEEAILQRKLNPGEKLPAERTLREIFKVSRGTVREALRALEQKKLICIKTGMGGGAFVCQVDTTPVTESLDILLRYQRISLQELADFRQDVEGLVAARAVEKAKKGDIRQLGHILKSMKEHLQSGELRWDEVIKEDKNFHLSLARIAGNRVFESILHTVYDNINHYFEQFLPKEGATLQKVYQDLYKIKEAMEERDAKKTKTILRRHVRAFNRMMKLR